MEWRTIEGYEGIYEISEFGDIRLIKRRIKGIYPENGIRKSWIGGGYKQMRLCKDGIKTRFAIHVLVAQHFIGEKPMGFQVNHIDGDKLNNHYSNLEYVTPSENSYHAVRLGLRVAAKGTERPDAKLTDQMVVEIREKYARGYKQSQLAEEYKIDRAIISGIVNRKRWKHVE